MLMTFYDKWYLKYFKYKRYPRWEQISPDASLFEYLQADDLSFVIITNLLRNKTRETLCKELKWMCKLSEINGQKDF